VPFEVVGELHGLEGALEPAALTALQNVRFWPLLATPPPECTHLHRGEQAAIGIATSIPGAAVILDEKDARAVARQLGLRVVGTLGVLLEAKREGLVKAIEPLIDRMIASGVRLGGPLVQAVLKAAGER
jgi:predicted nucleic acid-binding protein